MSIEIRQMNIKSTVLQRDGVDVAAPSPEPDIGRVKADILTECRQLVSRLLRESQER